MNKLREAEVLLSQGATAAEASKKVGITEQTYYRWRREYRGMRVEQAKRLKELEEENGRLKKHISMLKQKRAWSVLRLARYDKENQNRTSKQTEDCRYLLY